MNFDIVILCLTLPQSGPSAVEPTAGKKSQWLLIKFGKTEAKNAAMAAVQKEREINTCWKKVKKVSLSREMDDFVDFSPSL